MDDEDRKKPAITLNDLTVSLKGIDTTTLLGDWEWLLPAKERLVLVTAIGTRIKKFVMKEDGH